MGSIRQRLRRLRPPVVRQLEASDCGAAALLSLLRFWGGNTSLARVRRLTHTEARGTSLLELREAAGALGLRARGARGELEDLRKEPLPCIAHLILGDGRAHFVLVTSVGSGSVRLVDPAHGRRKMRTAEFERVWQSRAVLLAVPTPAMRRDPATRWLRRWLDLLLGEPAWVSQVVFLGLASTGLGLLNAIFIRTLVDRYIPTRNVSMVAATGGALALLLLFRVLAVHLRRRYVLYLTEKVASRSSACFLGHLYGLAPGFFERRATGDLTTRFADGLRVHGGLLELGGGILVDGLVAVGTVGFLFVVAPELAPLAAAALPLYGLVLATVAAPVPRQQALALSAYGHAESGFIDALDGVHDIQAFARGEFFAKRNAGLVDAFLKRNQRLGATHASLDALSELLAGAVVVGGLCWGALMVIGGDLMLGQLMAAYSLLASAAPSVDRVVRASVGLREIHVAASRFTDLLEVPKQPRRGGALVAISSGLRLDGVGVRWPNGERPFRGVDLALPVGQVTGLSGANGSGKTTLVRLLSRACIPSEGRVLADESPVEELELSAYRRAVGVFSCEAHLFQGTLADNVLLGRAEPDTAGALAGLTAMGFESFLHRFPRGWGTPLGRGGRRVSSGERQVVALMRALVDRPTVLLVDEGVTATDPELTRWMIGALKRYGHDHAVLLVSHDPAILRHADRICILADGRIVRNGTPEEIFSHGLDESPGGVPRPRGKRSSAAVAGR